MSPLSSGLGISSGTWSEKRFPFTLDATFPLGSVRSFRDVFKVFQSVWIVF